MASEVGLGLLFLFLLVVLSVVAGQAISFIFDVPKQLKRIADALEKEKKYGRN